MISEQVILITGASSGIGAALAELLAAQYMSIRLVIAARSSDKLEQVATQCRKAGAEVLVVPMDMADTEEVKALAQQALDTFGRVDVLVNNAGYGQMGPIELVTPEEAKRQFAVNYHGALTLIQSLIPGMREQGGGRIVNVSSLGGRMAFPVGGLYSSSKFALEALSDVLRMELGAFNIKVIVIEPGPVKTGFFEAANEKVNQSMAGAEESVYGPAIEKVKGMKQQTERLGWSSEAVAKVIVRSLTARNPRPRYVAATGGRILIFLLTKLFPTWVSDTFWKRFYGVNEVENRWKSRQKGKV
ncbi:MAG: SDR family oxidoreductase [Chroococcales cyanobacterium]